MSNQSSLTVKDEENIPENVGGFDLVNPEGAKAYWTNYEEVVNAILTKDDYQGTQFKKKSAYRKLATAFQFSDHVVKEDIKKDEKGRVISAEFHVQATAKNGRKSTGVGMCSLYDKIQKRDKTEPTEFELRKRFSNPDHDIISTAHTRAKNRAIADLIGTGEVSAEEMDIAKGDNPNTRTKNKRVKKSKKTKKEDNIIIAEVIKPELKLETTNVILGDWFRKLITALDDKGLEHSKLNLERIGKGWISREECPGFTTDVLNNILEQLEE